MRGCPPSDGNHVTGCSRVEYFGGRYPHHVALGIDLASLVEAPSRETPLTLPRTKSPDDMASAGRIDVRDPLVDAMKGPR